MRRRIPSLMLALALSACSFQVDVIETTTPLPSATAPAELSTASPFPTSALSTTPSALVTDTPAATEQVVVSTFAATDVLPIVFQANATSQIVVGSVPDGSSQTYSLTAFQGQVMSVSILPEKPELQKSFQLEIKGRDGTMLCPEINYVCRFWRGVLPSTQEYLIQVVPQTGGVFKLRIAINPPGQANQFFDYADPQGRYGLSYSDEFAPMHYEGAQASKFTSDFALQYIDTPQYVPTNLSEAYFLVGSSTDPQAVSTCTEPASLGGPESIVGNAQVKGVPFTKSQGGGVAAGSIYRLIFYRTVHNGTCYEITYFIHFGNIDNYSNNVREFDQEALLGKFDQVLSTFDLN